MLVSDRLFRDTSESIGHTGVAFETISENDGSLFIQRGSMYANKISFILK